jgi:hypothetical protein
VKPFDKLRASRAVVAALLMSSCGAPLLKLPTGPGAPATDAPSVIAQATDACRAVNTITLEMSVSGSAGGHRLRGRLTAGLARPASARLEAVAPFGQPVFVFVASGSDASLLLPRDRRMLEHGMPADVLEAITGVPLDAAALRALVTGCATAPDASDTVAFGETWRVAPDGADNVYIRRDPSTGSGQVRWRVVATTRRGENGWRAEYSMFEGNLPRVVRLVSLPAGRFDLELDLSQVELNVALGPEAFRLQQTGAADPITLDELRRSGPLGEK